MATVPGATTAAIAGGVGGGVLVTTGLGAVGFSSGGVVAGSIAAGIQAGIGNVAAGSLFALCQATAMGGFAALAVPITVGSTIGLLGYGIVKSFTGQPQQVKTQETEEQNVEEEEQEENKEGTK